MAPKNAKAGKRGNGDTAEDPPKKMTKAVKPAAEKAPSDENGKLFVYIFCN